jgi:adenosylmethionine-8-amino-7-oxononanoate aminotransferase
MQHFISPEGAPPFPKIGRGEGAYLWDTAGRRYLDGSSGAVASNIGHGNARVRSAMLEQAGKVSFAYARVWENEANEKLTERLIALSGWDFGAAFFVSGGTEAVEASLKFARQWAMARGEASRWKVISRMPSYHGSTLAVLGITGDDDFSSPFKPMLVAHPKIAAPLSYRTPDGLSAEDYARQCADALEACIEREGAASVLAFIMEPVGGVSTGALTAPDAYYARVREICDRYGVLLIFDEVMSGAGRTGRFLAAQHWPQCRPDIVVLAKGLSGGYAPLGAMLTSREAVDLVRAQGGFVHGHTYAANPMSCAIGVAVIEEIEAHGLIERAASLGERLQVRLREVQQRRRSIGDVRGRGLLCAVEIVEDRETKAMYPPDAMGRIRALAMDEGLVVLSRRTSGGRFGEWLMACPPLVASEADIDAFADMLDRALARFEKEHGGQIGRRAAS